jgi:uncharacterized protein YeaO (DUF488 family)
MPRDGWGDPFETPVFGVGGRAVRELVAGPLEAGMGDIRVARVYDGDGVPEGSRFLVERLWPRGVRRADLRLVDWLRDVAPSTELRRWFGHDPARWAEFCRRYAAELDATPGAWRPLLDAARSGPIVLLYSARDREHNNARALRDYLLDRR